MITRIENRRTLTAAEVHRTRSGFAVVLCDLDTGRRTTAGSFATVAEALTAARSLTR